MLGALGRKRPAKKKRDRKRRNTTWKSAGVLSPRRSTPKLSPRQRRRAQYDDAERNPSPPFPSSPLSHPSSLPRSPLSTSRRLSQWEREERRSIRVDVLCTMACLRERRALTPKVVLTRLHVLPRIDVAPPPLFPPLSSSPVSRRVLALSRRVPSPLPTYRATSATRRRRPLLRPPHSTMARVTFTKYRDYS